MKSKKSVAVVGVLYPGIEKYINEYEHSLHHQGFSEFDLLFLNDGLENIDFEACFKGWNLSVIDCRGTIAENRLSLIYEALKRDYRKLIFTDLDDLLGRNRVLICLELLGMANIIINDLSLADERGNLTQKSYLSFRFNDQDIVTEENILSGNMMGLSNVAVNTSVFSNIDKIINNNPIAFDWDLWGQLLMFGHNAMFTNKTDSIYRIHDVNIAGLPQKLSLENVHRGVKVKAQHYTTMAEH